MKVCSMGIKVKLNMQGLKQLEKKTTSLSRRKIKEGFFEGQHSSGVSNAGLALLLEYGRRESSENSYIPPRPAFSELIFKLKHTPIFRRYAQKLYKQFLLGEISENKFLESLGEFMAGWHKDIMFNWVSDGTINTSNAPLTIEMKGFNRPFYETGELIDSATYRIQ